MNVHASGRPLPVRGCCDLPRTAVCPRSRYAIAWIACETRGKDGFSAPASLTKIDSFRGRPQSIHTAQSQGFSAWDSVLCALDQSLGERTGTLADNLSIW
jgi:hypothetical protein